jgi:hypothetical protein
MDWQDDDALPVQPDIGASKPAITKARARLGCGVA